MDDETAAPIHAEIGAIAQRRVALMVALADLLGVEPKPLNAEHGEHTETTVAVIDEQTCIGCTLCIQACPVDAILGAAKQMHTVIESECTGCNLCIPPCPVDCIHILEIQPTVRNWTAELPDADYAAPHAR